MKAPVGYALLGNQKRKNQTQSGYSYAAVRLFGFGDVTYKASAFYIEFENMVDIDDPVSPPEGFSVNEGVEYYSGLISPRDYVRVPILLPPYADIDLATDSDLNNRLRWLAETTAVLGENGLAFTSGANSKIFGLALVAAPDWEDPTQDKIIGRRYYEEADQFARPAVGGVRVGWLETFPV